MKDGPHSSRMCSICDGGCCKRYDWVDIGTRDIQRMAKFLSVPVAEVYEMAVDLGEDRNRILRKKSDGWCIFHTAHGCGIYEGRPATCRDYMPPNCVEDHIWVAKADVPISTIIGLIPERQNEDRVILAEVTEFLRRRL